MNFVVELFDMDESPLGFFLCPSATWNDAVAAAVENIAVNVMDRDADKELYTGDFYEISVREKDTDEVRQARAMVMWNHDSIDTDKPFADDVGAEWVGPDILNGTDDTPAYFSTIGEWKTLGEIFEH